MPDQFWIVIVVIVVINVLKSARRRGSGGRPRGRRDHDRRPRTSPPMEVAPPQVDPPPGGWPLGLDHDDLTTFVTLQAPAARIGQVTTRSGTFDLGSHEVDADLALFTWTWQFHDDGRQKPRDLPVALVRLPAAMPQLKLRRPGRGVAWQGVVERPHRFSVDHAWDINPDDLRFASLFTPEFAAAMVAFPRLVFEASGDVLVVAPQEPRVVSRPGVVTSPPDRLAATATSTAEELPVLAELVARLLVTMPDAWWDQVLVAAGDVSSGDGGAPSWPSRDDVGAGDQGAQAGEEPGSPGTPPPSSPPPRPPPPPPAH